jgi:fatty-acyl-CoA synthase
MTAASTTEPNDWSLVSLLDIVAEAAPQRDALVWCGIRRTHAELADRSRRLGTFLVSRGLGARAERADLERWSCGQDKVALILSNCPQYLEAMAGAYRARAVPFNVNHHYNAEEVADLLDQIGTDAVIYHRRFGPLIAADPRSADRLLIDVDDGAGVAPLPGSIEFEAAIASADPTATLPEPNPDDLYMVCTGGTTGTPKGVLWRQADIYMTGMGGREDATRESVEFIASMDIGAYFPAPPLMHGAAQWTAFAGLLNGGTVVLHDDSTPFDAETILRIAEQERVKVMTVVGEAFGRPIVDELRRHDYDLSNLTRLVSGGAAMSAATKAELLELVPHISVMDGVGSSETGNMGHSPSEEGLAPGEFDMMPGTVVLSEDRTRTIEPGDDETGWVARHGRIPLAYLDQPEKTRATFPEIGGVRYSVPGDRARLTEQGTMILLGRDAMVVNSGGEKVFVEEVADALLLHPEVADAIVIGRPSPKLGSEVVALVALTPESTLTGPELREIAAKTVARFKAPRAVLICDRIGRLPTGKPDYAWARAVAADAPDATR